MRVIFLMFVFPDMRHSYNMYTTLAKEFLNNRHDVDILAPASRGGDSGLINEDGVDVVRVRTLPLKNVNNLIKGIANILLPFQFNFAYYKYFKSKKYDLIVTATPPITLVYLAKKIKIRNNAKLYLILRDIFPQNAVDMGFMKKRDYIYRYFRKKEIKLYDNSDHIGCMSQQNIKYIIKNNKSSLKKKLHIMRNFQEPYDNDGFDENEIRKKYRLINKFVVVFGGNMGKPQQIENVLLLAKKCSVYNDVIFLLIGNGTQIKTIEKQIHKHKIGNIRLLLSMPKKEYQDLIKASNIGLISLHENFTIPNIPSKTLDYFNVGLPVLASIDRSTDYGKILDEYSLGLWSYADQKHLFFANFKKLYFNESLRKEISVNVNNYFTKFLTPETAYKTIINNLG